MHIDDHKSEFEKTLECASEDINTVRTNRATPSLIENLSVEVYGSKIPLVQLAGITSPEPKQLLVEAWDKNVLKDIEKSIQTASLGLSVVNEGNHLRITMPPMTEETRNQIIKTLHEKIEHWRVSLRNLRDKIKEEITNAERNKKIGEDEKYKLIEDLDKTIREYTEKINNLGNKKENEIKV